MNITNPDRDDKYYDNEHLDHEHSDEDYYSFDDWQGMPYQMTCPYMQNCPFMQGMYNRDEDGFDEDFQDAQDVIRPTHRPRCRWPYRPCFYGGRWHCCRRRRRPRPRPWWMY